MTDFAAIFKAEGVPYVEVGNWRTRVRPGTFKPEGVIVHHTASTNYASTLRTVVEGRPDLNGPLCNIYIARGKAHIISAGRANHAGAGSSKALARMRKNLAPGGTAKKLGYTDDFTGGNGIFVGFEVLSPGNGTELPPADWRVLTHAIAAVLEHIKHPHRNRAIGHAEWTARKIDPRWNGTGHDAHYCMNLIRERVGAAGAIT